MLASREGATEGEIWQALWLWLWGSRARSQHRQHCLLLQREEPRREDQHWQHLPQRDKVLASEEAGLEEGRQQRRQRRPEEGSQRHCGKQCNQQQQQQHWQQQSIKGASGNKGTYGKLFINPLSTLYDQDLVWLYSLFIQKSDRFLPRGLQWAHQVQGTTARAQGAARRTRGGKRRRRGCWSTWAGRE